MRTLHFVVIFVLSGLSHTVFAALVIENDILMGATGIEVNGILYNVSFTDGSFNSLYGNGDGILFDLGTIAAANNELLRLLSASPYVNDPFHINGCTTNANNFCSVINPIYYYGAVFTAYIDYIHVSTAPFPNYNHILSSSYDFAADTSATFAVWTRAVPALRH